MIGLIIFFSYKYKTSLNSRFMNLVQRTRERLGYTTFYQPTTRQSEEYANRSLPAPVYPLQDFSNAQDLRIFRPTVFLLARILSSRSEQKNSLRRTTGTFSPLNHWTPRFETRLDPIWCKQATPLF